MLTLHQTLSALGAPSNRARVALVGAIVLSLAGAFAYTGGFLTATRTPGRVVDELEHVNGVHPGFRRNHAKGVGASGYFESNGQGARLSRATVFKPGERAQVLARFALAGGKPFVPDTEGNIRSLALALVTTDGSEWRTGMIDIPVFPVRSGQAFYQLTVASSPDPKTGKPNPEAMKTFLAEHPETARAFKEIGARVPASGFANSTFNGLNAFRFIDASGQATPVRWSLVPVEPFAPGVMSAPAADPNFLFDALVARLSQAPVRFRLIVTIGQPGDATNDATQAWPKDRQQIDAGTVVLDHVEGEATSPVRTINFDPLVLPDGMTASDDPLLSARSATYSQSFTRRASEPVSPSAVRVVATRK